MPTCPPPPPRQRGSALLILLAVLSMGAAAALMRQFGGAHPEPAREIRTLGALRLASDALVGYAMTHGRLPRPAISATDGRENPQPCASERDCSGLLPWVTLGIDSVDSWGQRLRYSVTPAFGNGAPEAGVSVATKTVQARDHDGRLRYVAGQPGCGPAAACAPAVVYSPGKNNFGTDRDGRARANAATGNLDEQLNERADSHFVVRASSADPRAAGGAFDDLLTWLPLQEYYRRMAAAGRLL